MQELKKELHDLNGQIPESKRARTQAATDRCEAKKKEANELDELREEFAEHK